MQLQVENRRTPTTLGLGIPMTTFRTECSNEGQNEIERTLEGGFKIRLINMTGADTVKGELVELHPTTTYAFVKAMGDCEKCFGVVYESGVPDGEYVDVVIHGIVDILLKDGVSVTRKDWVYSSNVSGRADAQTNEPDAFPLYKRGLGFSLETISGGTDVLCRIVFKR